MASGKPKFLVIAKTVPLHDRTSGDYRLFQLLKILAKDYEVHFLATQHVLRNRDERINKSAVCYAVRDGNFNHNRFEFVEERYFSDLRKIGVTPLQEPKAEALKVRPTNDYDIRRFLAAEAYDLVWVEFFYVADPLIGEIRRFQPWATLLVDSVDLHFRRLARQAEYLEREVRYLVNVKHERSPIGDDHRKKVLDHRCYADRVRIDELSAYERSDLIGVVSGDDLQELKRHLPNVRTVFLPNIHRDQQLPAINELPAFAKRKGIVFVGNFDHNPNVTSALYLKHEIAPLLEKKLGSIPIHLVGSNPPYILRTMQRYGAMAKEFKVSGWVPDTLPYLNRARVSVAPILFGAGMNGKIGEALGAGIPVVTTSLGALGMGLEDNKNCLVADSPQDFTEAIHKLYTNEGLWERIRAEGRKFVERNFGGEEIAERIRSDMAASLDLDISSRRKNPAYCRSLAPPVGNQTAKPAFKALKAKVRPDVSVIVLSYNQWAVTEFCLRSLAHAQKAYPEVKAEIILVDNASSDETRKEAKKIKGLKTIFNGKNLGFAAGNNVGIKAASGRDVILLNNDTVVPPHWLKSLTAHSERIPDLGIMGPSTNTETSQVLPGARYDSLEEFFQYNRFVEGRHRGQWDKVRKISGLCFYLPRNTIELVGLLDPSFGIGYFEDDDYCLRARDKGLQVIWAKDVYIHHFGSMSFEGNSLNRDRFLEQGMSRFAFKWGKRGLEHIALAHQETLLRLRQPSTLELV
jgi:O-antigen biosynthesis protein